MLARALLAAAVLALCLAANASLVAEGTAEGAQGAQDGGAEAAQGVARAAQGAQVEAGPLQARTTETPWSLAFTDRDGRPVLTEYPGAGSGPTGTLGFKTALGWFHATAR